MDNSKLPLAISCTQHPPWCIVQVVTTIQVYRAWCFKTAIAAIQAICSCASFMDAAPWMLCLNQSTCVLHFNGSQISMQVARQRFTAV